MKKIQHEKEDKKEEKKKRQAKTRPMLIAVTVRMEIQLSACIAMTHLVVLYVGKG